MGIIMSGFKDLVRLLPKTANRKPKTVFKTGGYHAR